MPSAQPRISDWLQLVRSEFVEIPGLCLTTPQAARLWGVDPLVCEAVLDALVVAGFLRRTREGFYLRTSHETAGRRRVRPLT